MPPTKYTELLEDTFVYEEDFREEIDNQAPGSTHMSLDVQEATVYGWVKANKLRSAFHWFLGFARADAGSPWRLRRSNPQPHLVCPWLYAYDVGVVEWAPKVSEAGDELDPTFLKAKKESPFEIPFFGPFYFALYEEALISVRFRNFLQRFREDEEITTPADEWKRHTWVQTSPSVEALTVTGGMSQLKFAETNAATARPAVGTPFGAPLVQLLSKKGIAVTWFDVPWEYLSVDEDVFTPTKIDAVIGKVNSDVFMNRFQPGTLLASAYTYTAGTWAVASTDTRDPLRKVTLTLPFTFFDPPRGAAVPVTRGHNLMPWGGTGKDPTPGGDKYFYYATRDGLTTGDPLIDAVPFQPIFTHVSS